MKDLGIYIHIPFCLRRCNYCGFYSQGLNAFGDEDGTRHAENQYVQWLIGQIRERGAELRRKYTVDTVFVGGGTPSILSAEAMEAILGAVRENFAVSSDAEITVECNPATLDARKLKRYRDAGINRLSIGAQSLDDGILQRLGRAHSASEFLDTYRLARRIGFDNINVDLMFAVPGQTMDQWKETVEQVLSLAPDHMSLYSLQIEEDTPFYDQYIEGTLIPVPDELDREMYHWAARTLKQRGYEHYEISNACLPGKECRHNLKYWSFDDYLGIGDSASSFIEGVRFTEKPREEYHVNDMEDNTGEFVFTGLRKAGGIRKSEFARRFGREFWDVYGDRMPHLEEFFQRGQLIEEGDNLRLSEEGIDISNAIMAMFV